MSKKRVLLVAENHKMATGFGTYADNVLRRWHETGKYEIAEFATGMNKTQALQYECPWHVYPNAPNESDPQQVKDQYNGNPNFHFGSWRFDAVCAHFKPDIVITYRDPWMDAFISKSPSRKYFHWVWMPTCDSSPQKQEWFEWFASTDAIFAYSEFGEKVLRKEGGGNLNVVGCASPAVDDRYHIIDKKADLRDSLGIDRDINIVGTVMRNQIRKLFPELFKAFRLFLDQADKEIADKTYLYLHTSYPEKQGWNIPDIISQYGIQGKVLSTYVCKACGHFQCTFFQDAITKCQKCHKMSAVMPNAGLGVTVEDQVKIYNLFDLYVQYANCLGKDEEILIKRNDQELWIPISQVKVGDLAWTHKNRWKNVSAVWENLAKSNGKKVMDLKVHGDYESLIATENHEFLAYTSGEVIARGGSVRKGIGDYLRKNKSLPEMGEYELSQLKKGDMLAFPINDSIVDIDKIDISEQIKVDIIDKDYVKINNSYQYPRYIDIDNEFCKFLGLFAADGSWDLNQTKQGIKITSNIVEEDNRELAQSVFSKLSIDNIKSEREYKGRKGVDDALWSIIYGKLFEKWFLKHENKALPDWCMKLPLEKQKEILIGMFIGDGHYCKEKNYSTISTISKKMAFQIKTILRRLRIDFSVCFNQRSQHNTKDQKNRKDSYHFEIYGSNIKQRQFPSGNKGTNNCYYGNYHLLKIKSIKENIDYKDNVYCLTVDDDHTMTSRIGATLQCEGFGMGQHEAAACGVPIASTDYSAMEDVVRWVKGYPIPVYKMFKDMGTTAERAYPDNQAFCNIMIEHFNKSGEERFNQGVEVHDAAKARYSWDETAKIWMDYIDSYTPVELQGQWNAPPNFIQFPTTMPNIPSNRDFIKWLCHTTNNPNRFYGYEMTKLLRDLNFGATLEYGDLSPMNRERIINIFQSHVNQHNQLEQIRSGQAMSNVFEFYVPPKV